MPKLPTEFYKRSDVTQLSRELLGRRICSNINAEFCSAIISETEAYAGIEDKASHAFGGKRTKRTEIMYAGGGVAYVYLCYGIHYLFNLVTNVEGIPHAILIRAIRAEIGEDIMLKRRKLKYFRKDSLIGPGKVSQALGISLDQNGISLNDDQIWLEETDIHINSENVCVGPRVGVDYAEEDALLPYRFSLRD